MTETWPGLPAPSTVTAPWVRTVWLALATTVGFRTIVPG